jgi:hypothetical protein
MPRSFYLGLFFLALTFMFLGVDALLWWKVSPSNPLDLGSIGTLGFVAMPYGIVVSHNNLNIGTIHPAILGTVPGYTRLRYSGLYTWPRMNDSKSAGRATRARSLSNTTLVTRAAILISVSRMFDWGG